VILKVLELKDDYDMYQKKLNDLLQAKKNKTFKKIPNIEEEIKESTSALTELEAELALFCKPLIQEIMPVRKRIIALLEEYRKLCSGMVENENYFLSHVVLAGQQLQMTIKKRKFLEQEYERIQENHKYGAYSSVEEIEADIKQSLHRAEVEFVFGQEEQTENIPSEYTAFYGWAADESVYYDELKKKEIVKEFRKIVLPRIHSDTSDTPFEVFNFVLGAYKRNDYLLMEAYIVQYREKFDWPAESEDIVPFVEILINSSSDNPVVHGRLEKRIKITKQHMSAKELENSDLVKEQLIRQNKEINKAINDEAEIIIRLMEKLNKLCNKDLF
jgi:hypothetical protein